MMKILSYLNISNIDDIKSDSGYIFNYLLYHAFLRQGISYKIILPMELADKAIHFDLKDSFYIKMGTSKFKARYYYPWDNLREILLEYSPDIILINQVELTAAFKALLNECGLSYIKLIAYCHYPALQIDEDQNISIDYTLDRGGIGQNIVFNILSAINIADAFVIQSDFAKNIILNFSQKHHLESSKKIHVLAPPYDPFMFLGNVQIKKSKKILYNHRLYDSYGTKKFIEFVSNNGDLYFIVTDPMWNRGGIRRDFNSTPEENRALLGRLHNIELRKGNDRQSYRQSIDDVRLAIAPHRLTCVWSMSIIDCYCRGVPVVGPNIKSLRGLIPPMLLVASAEEQRKLIDRLIVDDDFWLSAVFECRKKLEGISPDDISKGILSLI